MANEISKQINITGLLGNQTALFETTEAITWTNNGGLDVYFDVTTAAAGTLIDISSFVSTPGVAGFHNIDLTEVNICELGVQVTGTFFPFLSLDPGQSDGGGNLAITSFWARAAVATLKLRVFCLEK